MLQYLRFCLYLCHVRFSLVYICSTKLGEISDMKNPGQLFVAQDIKKDIDYSAAELRLLLNL